MSLARSLLLVAVGAALFAAGWWSGRRQPPAEAEAAAMPALSVSPAASHPAGAAPKAAVGTGDYRPPDISQATPAEVQALRQAEAERSAASAPTPAFRGIDGKLHRFDYADGQARVAEARRQERREQLMLELQSDPARFAREHELSLKQVQWIVDGDADFPDALLEP